MRESHLEQVERWARFIRNNPAKWKKAHTKFINALFKMHKDFYKRLAKTPEGNEKIAKLLKLRQTNH